METLKFTSRTEMLNFHGEYLALLVLSLIEHPLFELKDAPSAVSHQAGVETF